MGGEFRPPPGGHVGKRYKRDLQLFTVARNDPKARPVRAETIPVAADSVAGLLGAAEGAILAAGHETWRSLSYGPNGLVAYVEGGE